MRDIEMEEERKEKRKRGSIEKGEWFKGLDTFTDAQRSMMAEWYAYAMKYAETEVSRRQKLKEMVPSSVIRDASEEALMYAVTKWKPDGGCNFKTFFHNGFFTKVSNAVNQYIRNRDKYISENCKILSKKHPNLESSTTLGETGLFSNESFEDSIIGDIYVDELLSKLTELQQTAVRRCYLYGERQSDVARDMGVTKQNINNALSMASNSLRMMINGEIERPKRGPRKKIGDDDNG